MTKRVLVTGSSGRIGAAAVTALADGGWLVTGLDRVAPADTAADRVVVGSIADEDVVRDAVRDAQVVVHLAALIEPNAGTPVEVFCGNTAGTFTVLACAVQAGATRVVIASSINATGVFYNRHVGVPPYYPIDELIPPDIADPYSLSKQTDELSLAMWHRAAGIDGLALRFPWVADAEAIQARRQQAAADPMIGSKEGWSYLDVRDAGDLVRTAIEGDWGGMHVVQVAGQTSYLDMPTREGLALTRPEVPVMKPIPAYAPAVSTARLEGLLGWKAAY